ncbi:MAG: DNA primase, partial [Planctomycetota bacterium]
QVQQATDIVDLISQYVALKQRGKEFIVLCPFHDDHRPSLNISPTKQIFKCFACGAGGSAFNFVMRYEKVSFPEAVRSLAERANIPLPREAQLQPAQPGLSKNDLLAVTDFAAKFYRSQLHSPAGAAAMEYARQRGLSDESIERFGLGYAPDEWDSLLKAARRRRFSEAQLIAAGLAIRREQASGCYDRFRNRLIFAIFDPAGSVIAFGGRALDESEHAKYLNSPESALFDKSAQLYGLNWAREAIVSSGQAVVVEGYLDALAALQAGVGNVVATLGTALTDRHVRLLARYARDVVLLFDADTAGAAAAERALETFLTQQFHVRVAAVAAGDPCDFVLSEGPDAFRKLIAEAPDALRYAWGRCRESLSAYENRPADRRKIVDEFLRLVASSSAYGAIDEVRRGELAQHIGHMLNVPTADLQQHMRRLARQVQRKRLTGKGPEPPAEAAALAERHILEVLLNRMDLLDSAAERLEPRDFASPALRTVAERLWKLKAEGRANLDDLLASEAGAEHGALVAGLVACGQRRGNYEATLQGAVEDLLYRRDRRKLEQLKGSGYSDETLKTIMQRHRRADRRRHPKIT